MFTVNCGFFGKFIKKSSSVPAVRVVFHFIRILQKFLIIFKIIQIKSKAIQLIVLFPQVKDPGPMRFRVNNEMSETESKAVDRCVSWGFAAHHPNEGRPSTKMVVSA